MGLVWAVHWATIAHGELLRRAGVRPEKEFVDKSPVPVISPGAFAHLVHIDNEVFIAPDPTPGGSARERAFASLDAQKLPAHDIESNTRLLERLGLELDGLQAVCS